MTKGSLTVLATHLTRNLDEGGTSIKNGGRGNWVGKSETS